MTNISFFSVFFVSINYHFIAKYSPLARNFKSLEDLVKQDDIKFSCVEGGATERFFKNSKVNIPPQAVMIMEKVKFDNLVSRRNQRISHISSFFLLKTPIFPKFWED